MENKKYKLELDLDGVITDCFYGINKIVREQFGIHDFDVYTTKDYSFKDYSPEVQEAIHNCFECPKYMGNIKLQPDAEEAIWKIKELVESGKIELHINSLTYNEQVRQERLKWIPKYFGNLPASITIPTGRTKPMLSNVDITIEDSISNLHNASSKYKFLIKTNSNEHADASDVPNLVKHTNLLDALDEIEKLVELKF